MVNCCPKYSRKDLREPVEFQKKTRISDGAGGFSVTWPAISGAATRGKFWFASGHERFASERVEARVTARLVVRYFAGLLEADRVEIRGKPYNIRFINNLDLRDEWLEISLDGGVAT